MYALFTEYWWLLFPLSWFAISAWRNWLSYRAEHETMELMKTYARNGKEPPAGLIARLDPR
jgi:hypothetical protein